MELAKGVKFHWELAHQTAFDQLKNAITAAPVLMQPNFENPFIVDTDASDHAIGVVLQQKDNKGKLHPCAYLSRTLDKTQQNWDVYDKELFAVVEACREW